MTAAAQPGRSLPASWSVQLPVFEGPLDLLLHLVRVNEVEITDIPVAVICDQFHEYLGLMEELNLDIAAEYLYEAALLVQLKSRLLLPRPPAAAGGEPESDPRLELVERLLEYRRIQEAAQSLAEVHQVRRGIWSRPPSWAAAEPGEAELDLGEVSLFDLLGALRRVLSHYDREHPPAMVVPAEAFSVRQQIERFLGLLAGGRPLDLLADLAARSCRGEAVAAFLAALELVRLGAVDLHATAGGELLLRRTARELEARELESVRG